MRHMAKRGDGRKLEEFRWKTSGTPKQSTRYMVVLVLRLATRARKTTWTQNQSSCAPTSHTFTRSARKERTVVLVSPADHAQHVKEGAVRENVTQGVIDSPQQQARRAKPTAGEKSNASRREEQPQQQTERTKGLRTRQG